LSQHLLSDEEVKELTGYEKPSFQASWCRKNGVRFFLNAAGQVKVPAVALAEKPGHNQGHSEPDFSQFHGAA